MKLNFFIVGAPKCGTTSLYSYLKQHPEIYLPQKKEPHFFCTDFHQDIDEFHGFPKAWNIRSLEKFHELFSDVGDEKLIGEASTSYLYSSTAAREIYEYNPNAKIIINLREPVDFLYSWHSHLSYYFEENLSFYKAIKAENNRVLDSSKIPRKVTFPFRIYYSKMVQFSEQINRYKQFFPDSQILIVLLDDLKNDVQTEYKRILRFLNVDPNFAADFDLKNTNKVQSSRSVNWLLNNNAIRPLKYLFPKSAVKTFVNNLRRLNTKETKRPELDLKIRAEIKELMAGEVSKLSKVIDRDLKSLWNYP